MCEYNYDVMVCRLQSLLELHAANSTDAMEILGNLRLLRNSCRQGVHFQELVTYHEELQNVLHSLIFDGVATEESQRVKLMAAQLLANASCKNANCLRLIWQRHGETILQQCAVPPLGRHTDVLLMIIYNVFNGDAELRLSKKQVLCIIVRVWQVILAEQIAESFDFLHFLFEYFLVENGRRTVRYYAQHLNTVERIAFLDYLVSYLQHDSPNGRVHSFLLQHLSNEFKLKSDCVLRNTPLTTQQQSDAEQAREAYGLLRVIASASGCETYSPLYNADHSLFLNVSSLLRCVVAVGKESMNMFTPMNKLEEVALASNIPHGFETEVSFELRTLLVRSVANLLYKNPTNQAYCLDTQLMPTLLECTNMDARNPLIKEWSILAIRNACIDCPEIQQIIANLTNQGTAQNDILNELNLEMGSLRIQPSPE